MTISEAITAVLSASHHGDQHFRSFLMCDEAAEWREALVALADAVRDEPEDVLTENESEQLIDYLATLPERRDFKRIAVRYVHSLEGIKPSQVDCD